ncbi:MAG: TerB family tellurite resistance protein [Bacteroidetes bacterium]|nr:TerB family tellurite resistance protein [Bacteroidota bacterium]MCH8032644.1 TerB family tellurite resistance protein [Bacteroidota bacterium]
MFEYLKRILSNESNEPLKAENADKSDNHDKQLQIATAAIFIEMAKADGEFSDDERDLIIQSLKKRFNLNEQDIHELIELSKAKLDESISLYEFSNTVNEHFTTDDKMVLLKNLWRMIYADKKLNRYEDHLIKMIGGMLQMEHKKIINAKMLIRKELNIE